MMKYIYETRGPAKEYCRLAVNLYRGCVHGCRYCYAPDVLRMPRAEFHGQVRERPGLLAVLEKEAHILGKNGASGTVLLCFTTDPCQKLVGETPDITAQAVKILQDAGLSVALLTKGGLSAREQLEVLLPGRDEFATTLTLSGDTRDWEPRAAPTYIRIMNLKAAHDRGLRTWVSFEPVLYPDQTLELMRRAAPYADLFKVGKLNHYAFPELPVVNWRKFAADAEALAGQLGVPIYLKKELLEAK